MASRDEEVPTRENSATLHGKSSPEERRVREDARGGGDRAGYLAFVAHEMRNPLATALWSAELLARLSPEERGGARGEKLAGMCLRTLARLRHLVEDHFLAERLAIHGIPVREDAVALAEALSAAAGRVAGLRWQGEVAPAVLVSADRAMLERALEALLAAAARGEAAVTVTARSMPEENAVSVEVRGASPPEDAFRLPDRSTPSDPTGRALGILMARAVAYAHGGSLALMPDGYALVLPGDAGAAGDER
jgi:K+-sensing histidine kinase KdpD